MSSFCGQMREYRNISLDRFDGKNLNAMAYVLSHCHEDHTVGLAAPAMFTRLRSNLQIKVYCSEVTKCFLASKEKYQHLDKHVEALPIEETVPLVIPSYDCENETILMTLLPAGHCPGSVMCLIEGGQGTALYTGDFRLEHGSAKKFKALHSSDGFSVKEIQSMYVDTTFCTKNAVHIPSRAESTSAALELVKDWIGRSPQHIVRLNGKACFGYEDIYVKIHERFGMKAHVNLTKYGYYASIPDIVNHVTMDQTESQIHACWYEPDAPRDALLPCRYDKEDDRLKVLKITLSTMWFTQQVGLDKYVVRSKSDPETNVRVCYSFHSSYSEVKDIVTYLRPRQVFPNVIPIGETEADV